LLSLFKSLQRVSGRNRSAHAENIKNEMGRKNMDGFTQAGKRKHNNLSNKMELLR